MYDTKPRRLLRRPGSSPSYAIPVPLHLFDEIGEEYYVIVRADSDEIVFKSVRLLEPAATRKAEQAA